MGTGRSLHCDGGLESNDAAGRKKRERGGEVNHNLMVILGVSELLSPDREGKKKKKKRKGRERGGGKKYTNSRTHINLPLLLIVHQTGEKRGGRKGKEKATTLGETSTRSRYAEYGPNRPRFWTRGKKKKKGGGGEMKGRKRPGLAPPPLGLIIFHIADPRQKKKKKKKKKRLGASIPARNRECG